MKTVLCDFCDRSICKYDYYLMASLYYSTISSSQKSSIINKKYCKKCLTCLFVDLLSGYSENFDENKCCRCNKNIKIYFLKKKEYALIFKILLKEEKFNNFGKSYIFCNNCSDEVLGRDFISSMFSVQGILKK